MAGNTFDITKLNDAEVELFLGLAADRNGCFDLDGVRNKPLRMILEHYGMMTPRWANSLAARDCPGASDSSGFDHEGAILARQEADASRWT